MIRYYRILNFLLICNLGFAPIKANTHDQNKPINKNIQTQYLYSESWQLFSAKNPGWSVLWNEMSGTPHRAFGPAIQIDGFNDINQLNVEQAARHFLMKYADIFNINLSNLRLKRAIAVKDRWYVGFRQIYEGYTVLNSEVELRIFKNGKVMAFGLDYFHDIKIDKEQFISASSAADKAIRAIPVSKNYDQIKVDDQLYIYPVIEQKAMPVYRVVYIIKIKTAEPAGNYVVYVDALKGDVLYHKNHVYEALTSGETSGDVQIRLPYTPEQSRAFSDLRIQIDDQMMISDSDGYFNFNIDTIKTLSAQLKGAWIDVQRMDGTNAKITRTVQPGDSVKLTWDDSNSHAAERNAYYHITHAHNHMLDIDPDFSTLNFAITCNVNQPGSCGGWYDGHTVNFRGAGNGCYNSALSPSIIYHEYGHAIIHKMYQLAGANNMGNKTTHEALADVIAILIEDQPLFAPGYRGAGSFARSLQNNNRYPDDISGQYHNDGLILGGAIWDLRQLTDIQTARYLAHYAMYGLPDDANTAVAFSEWFLEILIADDDDGDLGNGTPHYNEIVGAFNMHGIGTSLFLQLAFSHTPVTDTQDTTNAYVVEFNYNPGNILTVQPDSIGIYYSCDDFISKQFIPAVHYSANTYRAEIPSQPAGTLLKYYITAQDPLSKIKITLPVRATSANHYSFLVGSFDRVFYDTLEVLADWQTGMTGDDATDGVWELAVPEMSSYAGALFQPGKDHSPSGLRCFVTGSAAGQGYWDNDVDNGKTTLISPVFDLSFTEDAIISFYQWYMHFSTGYDTIPDIWKVEITNNMGISWFPVLDSQYPTSGWQQFRFKVGHFVQPNDSVQVRFIVSDYYDGSIVEALIDDFEIYTTSGNVLPIGREPVKSVQNFELKQNYPNPFNPFTTIKFSIPNDVYVLLTIYNLLGQHVATLVTKELTAGSHSYIWDASAFPSGVYYYRLVTNMNFVQTRKMVLLR